MNVVLHPSWVTRVGVGDIVRHFQTRGLDVSNVVGSRFFHIELHPQTLEPASPWPQLFRPNSQRNR